MNSSHGTICACSVTGEIRHGGDRGVTKRLSAVVPDALGAQGGAPHLDGGVSRQLEASQECAIFRDV